MHLRFFSLTAIGLSVIWVAMACAPKATPTPPIADAVSTAVFQTVYAPLTQTAVAVPSDTLSPPTATVTLTPVFTETPTSAASRQPLKRPVVLVFAGCWLGPGPKYTLISNISAKKYVELLGIGNVPGWYIIKNPYFHRPCWMEAVNLKLDPALDLSKYPVMTPGP